MKSGTFCFFPKVLVGHLGFKNGKLLLWNFLIYAHIRTNQKIKSLSQCFDVPVLLHLIPLQIGTELKSLKIYTEKKVSWGSFVFFRLIQSDTPKKEDFLYLHEKQIQQVKQCWYFSLSNSDVPNCNLLWNNCPFYMPFEVKLTLWNAIF